MADVIVVSTDDEPEAEEVAEEVVEEAGTDAVDAVEIAVEIQLVERVTRLEDALTIVSAVVEEHSEMIAGLQVTDEIQQMEISAVAEETQEVAEGAGEAIVEVAEATEKDSPSGSEVTPDEVPATREHWFFKNWRNR